MAGIAALAFFFPLSLIWDWSLIAPVFTIIYYLLQKVPKENLSLILIPASYFIFRTILYTETQFEHETGTNLGIPCCSACLCFQKEDKEGWERKSS